MLGERPPPKGIRCAVHPRSRSRDRPIAGRRLVSRWGITAVTRPGSTHRADPTQAGAWLRLLGMWSVRFQAADQASLRSRSKLSTFTLAVGLLALAGCGGSSSNTTSSASAPANAVATPTTSSSATASTPAPSPPASKPKAPRAPPRRSTPTTSSTPAPSPPASTPKALSAPPRRSTPATSSTPAPSPAASKPKALSAPPRRSTPATSLTPAPPSRPPSAGQQLSLAVNPEGQLKYNKTSLSAQAGTVSIAFTNRAPLGHNMTVASPSNAVVGATRTFQGGAMVLTLNLKPGTYKFYCSVPGHRMAGMEGTLTVK